MADKINQIEISGIIYDLQDKDAKAPFTGTKAEVQLAIAEGKIKEGDIVNITDDINDYPGGGDYPSGASNIVYLTQEQYDALPDDKLTDDIEYRITDEGTDTNADNVGYNNATSGLSAMNVQDAIDEVNGKMNNIQTAGIASEYAKGISFYKTGNICHVRVYGVAQTIPFNTQIKLCDYPEGFGPKYSVIKLVLCDPNITAYLYINTDGLYLRTAKEMAVDAALYLYESYVVD